VCNVLSIRKLGYNCAAYLNRQLTDNLCITWAETHACAKDAAHIYGEK
jgi:hypothetical protein